MIRAVVTIPVFLPVGVGNIQGLGVCMFLKSLAGWGSWEGVKSPCTEKNYTGISLQVTIAANYKCSLDGSEASILPRPLRPHISSYDSAIWDLQFNIKYYLQENHQAIFTYTHRAE